ncbi:tripartite tricarboxylate transporter substrate binding protein [Diaphorobacter sp. HDW4B]|uniref:Bug family tripartite tricarboxylate transporter substrate binding protein n=1 Tax=Diaphorobacter sp. HDW4B TaxID=2714925 RepID=UPI0014093307|nr:tripartite tricarboxylate transporter substrate binding protein [Diaphorobacter sp. HDW4B]QIL70798.1 tripartite tricarboxylate transporter substrate binding protein [Diaphorobacter sp. HDW4B]
MPIDRRSFLVHSGALALPSALLANAARAESAWPEAKPIRVVIPYAAGGVTDSVGRKLVEQVSKVLGQSMIVENKGGAGGTVGMQEVAKARPDGYTLALSAISPLTLSPHLGKLGYDASKDIVPVAPMMYSPVYVLATTAFTGTSWEDLIAQAKAKPDTVRFATSGIGSVGHIMLEQIQAKTGAKFIHVPYKGVGQTVTDAVGGQFEIMTGNPFGTINTLIEQGKLRVLATTGPQRAPNQPNIATLAEKGVPEANLTSLFGFMAPAGTAPPIIARLNEVVQAQVATPSIQETLRATDNVGLRQSAAEFAEFLKQESRNNAEIIKKANITM